MTPGLLDPSKLLHPCEAAFEVFLGPCDGGTVLYLRVQNSSQHPGRLDLTGCLQSRGDEGKEPDSIERNTLKLHRTHSLTLLIKDTTCDRVVVHVNGTIDDYEKTLPWLLGEIKRALTPAGELLFLWREHSDESDTDATAGELPSKHQKAKRLANAAKIILSAFDLRWQHAIKDMLQTQGFDYSEWYLPEFTASGLPAQIYPLQNVVGFRGFQSWKKSLQAIAMRSVLIRASIDPLGQSILQKALAQTSSRTTEKTNRFSIDSILVSPKEKVVVIAKMGHTSTVLRLPFSKPALAGCRQNMKALEGFHQTPGFKFVTPQPIIESDYNGWYFSAESFIQGAPLRRLSQDKLELELAENLMRSLNPVSGFDIATLEGPLFDELIGKPLQRVKPLISSNAMQAAVQTFFKDAFYDSRFVVGISHGDLSLNNIYLRNSHVSGIIDWDEGSMQGLPILDAIGHLLSRQTRRRQNFSDAVLRLAARRWPSKNELQLLDRLYTYYRIEPTQHFALVMLQWLHIASNQSQHWFAQHEAFTDQYIDGIVAVIAEHHSNDLD